MFFIKAHGECYNPSKAQALTLLFFLFAGFVLSLFFIKKWQGIFSLVTSLVIGVWILIKPLAGMMCD